MKRKLLSLLGILFFSTSLFSQCEVQTDFSDVEFGFSPDSVTDFASATLNNIYSQQFDVKVPVSGSALTPPLPFVTVDSVLVTGIIGLPPGINYECNSTLTTDCAFPGGGTGCAVLSGIPTEAGNFDLIINADFYTNFSSTPVGLPIEGYTIFVQDPLSVNDELNIAYSELKISPNPVREVFKLQTNSKDSGSAIFRIYDLLGQEVIFQNVMIEHGNNSFDVNVSDLPEGVYITRLDAFGSSRSARLVIIE